MTIQIRILVFLLLLNITKVIAQENFRNRINYLIATIDKMLGDEYFMNSQHDTAKFMYQEAKQYIKTVDADGHDLLGSVIDLLNKDIDYRLLLIENRFEFYGVTASGKPHNPIKITTSLKKNIIKLKEAYDDIIKLYDDIDDDKDKLTDYEAQSEWNSYKQQSFEIDESRIELLQDYQSKIIDQSRTYLNERQKELDQNSTYNRTAISNSIDQLNEMIIEGIELASGLPPELRNIDPNDPLEKNMLNIASKMLQNKGSFIDVNLFQ